MKFLPLLALGLLALPGCVERWLLVRTDPPGAQVFLDARAAGRSPARIPFQHYGTREVLVRLAEHESHAEEVAIQPPWYEWFPIDFIAENLWPWTIEDTHVVNVTLRPLDEERLRAEILRQAAAPPAPPPAKPPAADAGGGAALRVSTKKIPGQAASALR